MPEIILEISLNRSSGVLAGIVASLAQAGIELNSQKLRRATEERGAWLTINGVGDSPAPEILAERLNGTRGVEKLMRVTVDGEAILAEGEPLEEQIQPDDLAELSARGGAELDEPSVGTPAPEDPPEVLEADQPQPPAAKSASAPDESTQAAAQDSEGPDRAAIPESANPLPNDEQAPEVASEPAATLHVADERAETNEHLAAALHDADEPAETNEHPSAAEGQDEPARAFAAIRRRRRRRR